MTLTEPGGVAFLCSLIRLRGSATSLLAFFFAASTRARLLCPSSLVGGEPPSARAGEAFLSLGNKRMESAITTWVVSSVVICTTSRFPSLEMEGAERYEGTENGRLLGLVGVNLLLAIGMHDGNRSLLFPVGTGGVGKLEPRTCPTRGYGR